MADQTALAAPAAYPGADITVGAGGLVIRSFDDLWRFAAAVSKSGLAPKGMERPETIMIAIQHGMELGLQPMQALQSIAVINGRPTIWGDAALALVKSSPLCEYVIEELAGTGEKMVATCRAKRHGQPETVRTFSADDAKRAGLWGKAGPWTQYPQRMCPLRARGFALRDAFPDLMRGIKTAEEVMDYDEVSVVDGRAEVERKMADGPPAKRVAAAVSPPTTQAAPEIEKPAAAEIAEQLFSGPVKEDDPKRFCQ